MAKRIKIVDKILGKGQFCYVIAEAGVNHNGKFEIAKKLITAAKEAGADAVKFQTFRAEQVAISGVSIANYQTGRVESEDQQRMLKDMEFDEAWYPELIKYANELGITFLSTPHGGFESIDLLESFNVPAYKFGSGDLNNIPVLKYAAKLQKPMIISSGMANIEEIQEAIEAIKGEGNNQIVLLHCTTNYPTPFKQVNLNAMLTLMKKFEDVLIGYSDHTDGVNVAIMAATLGACVIEKHFTLNRRMRGPDHPASTEPEDFMNMVEGIKNIPVVMGSFEKVPNPDELKVAKIARKSIVTLADIEKGKTLNAKNIGIKRPATGIQPKEYEHVLGKRARRKIAKDKLLRFEDFI